MSDFSDLTVGLSGLEAQQMGMDTVGQNVANADTPGYVDEQVELAAVGSVQHQGFDQAASALPGDGVEITGVDRLSNSYLQQRSYSEQASQGMLTAQQSGLQAIQQNFPEPSSNGISSQLTKFWQDWSTLANNPSDGPTRAMLVQDAGTLTSSLNQTSTALGALSQQTTQEISATLAQVNQDASQIAALNQSILAAGTSGNGSTNEMEDQRDQIVSQLSNQIGVSVSYNQNGTINVYSGSEPLVSAGNYQQLSLSQSGPPFSLVWSADDSTYQPGSGALAGMLDVVNQYVPQYQQGLDQVAQSLMGSVNYLMSTGYDLDNQPGGAFFLGSGAADIEVNPALAADPSLVAAASSPTTPGSSATNEDGTIAAEMGELPNSETATLAEPAGGWAGGTSAPAWSSAGATTATGPEADVAYNELVSGIGQTTSSVNNSLTNQQAVTTNVNSALQSATGVNTDEELTKMVQYQNAYDASAKYISTVDSILQSLISMVQG
ncbi:MAG: flagellar hook-associated protein FlgK [Acidimicrobiales bacterium]